MGNLARFPEVMARTAHRASPKTCPIGMAGILCGPDRMALKATTPSSHLASAAEIVGIDPRTLETAFICEDWNAELATGILSLGRETAALHGLAGPSCGIMDLIRLYDSADLIKVLQALEDAAISSTTFAYSTSIRPAPGLYRPVFCFGQSQTDGTTGTIRGTFAVARLCFAMSAKPEALN